jgi:hypothetical protein
MMHNLRIKIFCVVVAFALWCYIKEGELVERRFTVMVTPQGLPSKMEIFPPQRVLLVVKGQRGLLEEVRSEDFYLPINLQGKGKGQYIYSISPDKIRVPKGLEIVDFFPKEIFFVVRVR